VVTNLVQLTVGTNASFTQLHILNNSKVTNIFAYVGYNLGSQSNTVLVDGAGSHWEHGNLDLGEHGGWNRLIITNGASVSGGRCYYGYLTPATNQTIVVTGSGSRWLLTNNISAGKGGNSRIVVTNGGIVSCAGLGLWDQDAVVITGSGSSWTNVTLTMSSSNKIVITNQGSMVTSGTANVGSANPIYSNNMVMVAGPGSAWRQTALYVGNASSFNQLLLTEGGTIMSGNATVGGASSSNNQMLVTGAGSLWTNLSGVTVGSAGKANQLVVSNSGTAVSFACFIGSAAGSDLNNVLVTGSNSTFKVRGDFRVGSGGTRNYLVATNGASAFANRLIIGNGNNSNSVTVGNGSLLVTNDITVACGALTLNAGLVKSDRIVLSNNAANGRLIFNGGTLQTHSITGYTSLQYIGNGVSPATWEMLDDGTNIFSPGGELIVSSNGCLKGAGTIIGDVSLAAGATISPGATLGGIGVVGYLALYDGSTTVMDLDATTSAADRINVSSGVISYGGTLQLTNVSGAYSNGQTFALFNALGYGGRFTNVIPATPGPGWRWNTNGLRIDGTLRVAAVPTPPPHLRPPTFSGSNLSMAVSGGNAYEPCYLLSTTNVMLPFTSWSRLKTNSFNSSGNVTITIPKSPGDPQRYYTVQVP
jgi:T5SS/PEP-CTERM-associated repeat protein